MEPHGKRTASVRTKIKELQAPVSIEEGIALVKEAASKKFDEAVEVHMNLGIDRSKSEHIVRGTVVLPHGTGTTLKIACFAPESEHEAAKAAGATIVGGEELVEQILKSEKTDFDIAVATPDMMRHLGKIGKILGMRGLMPNPKNETVTKTPVKTIEELSKGKITFRNDDGGNLHQAVGKASFTDEQLKENVEAYVAAIKKAKPDGIKGTYLRSVTLSSTMGPGVPITA
ncbi:MAG: 50S ribosomal protein L1 [Candidatus Doudnabacteria bacterium]|nr:50S ribosomal protein L1 [Candidatus Doudnabacteria bacterium]MCA9387653.1 50S ribosomal protein L1 [Candidatus Andersenbacteria bacterium]